MVVDSGGRWSYKRSRVGDGMGRDWDYTEPFQAVICGTQIRNDSIQSGLPNGTELSPDLTRSAMGLRIAA